MRIMAASPIPIGSWFFFFNSKWYLLTWLIFENCPPNGVDAQESSRWVHPIPVSYSSVQARGFPCTDGTHLWLPWHLAQSWPDTISFLSGAFAPFRSKRLLLGKRKTPRYATKHVVIKGLQRGMSSQDGKMFDYCQRGHPGSMQMGVARTQSNNVFHCAKLQCWNYRPICRNSHFLGV